MIVTTIAIGAVIKQITDAMPTPRSLFAMFIALYTPSLHSSVTAVPLEALC